MGDLLKEHAGDSRLATEGSAAGDTSVIIVCDPSFDEGVLASTPHIKIGVEEPLLQKMKELQEENTRLRALSLVDNLTGLSNKRFFWMQLETEMARTKRTGHPFTLMMIDVDNFKSLNDSLGHLEGDRFLEEFGRIVRENSRSTDMPCRYGGDEFALIMPATSVRDALKTGKRLMGIVAGMEQKSDPPVSLSIGISQYTSLSSYTAHELVDGADTALYEAKGEGKNQVRIDRNWKEITLEDGEVSHDEKDALFTNSQ